MNFPTPPETAVVDEPAYDHPACRDRGWIMDPSDPNTVRSCGCMALGAPWGEAMLAAGAVELETSLASGTLETPEERPPGFNWGAWAATSTMPPQVLVYHDYYGRVVATTGAAVAARAFLENAGRRLVWCRARAFEDDWALERADSDGDGGAGTRRRLLGAGLLVVIGIAWQDPTLERAKIRMGAWGAVLAERRAQRRPTLLTSPREPRFWGDEDLTTIKWKDV